MEIFEQRIISPSDVFFIKDCEKYCAGCEKYNKTWSCPPAADVSDGKILTDYKKALLFSVKSYKNDFKKTWADARELTLELRSEYMKKYKSVLAVGCSGCTVCEKCSYPEKECLFPEKMLRPMESYSVDVFKTAEKAGLTTSSRDGNYIFFASIFFG